MTAPTVAVFVGYGSTWQTPNASISWTDESCRVNDRRQLVSSMRGATSAHGKAGAGTIHLTFNNKDRELDPLNTAGPHFGDLVPGVPIKVEIAGVEVARGFVKSWPQHPDGATFTTVPVKCLDGFQNLSRAPIPSSVLEYEIAQDDPAAYWRLDEESGSTQFVDSVGDAGGQYDNVNTFRGGVVPAFKSSPHFDRLGDSRGFVANSPLISGFPFTFMTAMQMDAEVVGDHGLLYGANDFSLSTYFTVAVNNPPAEGQLTAVFAVNGAFPGYAYAGEPRIDDGKAHYVQVVFPNGNPSSWRFFIDGVETANPVPFGSTVTWPGYRKWALGNTVANRAGDYGLNGDMNGAALIDADLSARAAAYASAALAPWAEDRSGERLERLATIVGWPADLLDIAPGQSFVGPALFDESDSALSYFQLLEATEDGRLFVARDGNLTFHDRFWPYTAAAGSVSQFTFTDEPGGAGYADFVIDPYAIELVLNAFNYARRNGGNIRGQDDASVNGEIGYREDSQTGLLLGTDNEVRQRGQWTLLTRSTPLPQVDKIRIPLHTYSPTDQAAVLALDLGHRVSASRTPQGVGDPIELDFVVSGIQITAGVAECWVELYVSPAVSDEISLFALGTSTLGGSDVLAY